MYNKKITTNSGHISSLSAEYFITATGVRRRQCSPFLAWKSQHQQLLKKAKTQKKCRWSALQQAASLPPLDVLSVHSAFSPTSPCPVNKCTPSVIRVLRTALGFHLDNVDMFFSMNFCTFFAENMIFFKFKIDGHHTVSHALCVQIFKFQLFVGSELLMYRKSHY